MAKKIPVRTCAGCGAKKDKNQLIRIVRSPSGKISTDFSGRAQGRGVYLCPDPACVEKAQKKHALSRSLGVPVPDEICRSLMGELDRAKPQTQKAADRTAGEPGAQIQKAAESSADHSCA